MNVKTGPNLKGLMNTLKKRGIKILGKKDNVIIVGAKGVFLEGVLPPGKMGERKRVIRFSKSKKENDIIDPASYGFIAQLAKEGLKILIQPLPKENSGDSKKSPSFWKGGNILIKKFLDKILKLA